RTRGSRTIDMLGKLHGDIFAQDKLLTNGVDVKIKLVRSRDQFCLMFDKQGLQPVPAQPLALDPAVDAQAQQDHQDMVDARNAILAANAGIEALLPPNFRFEIQDIQLGIRYVRLSNTKFIEINDLMKEGRRALYPISRAHIRSLSISAGKSSALLDNIFQGQLPKRVVLGFVFDEALNGHHRLNLFDF
ncbi:MAG TPA: hypothetical protein VM260_26920, partial [Pirellula sp.]|nr:hypothetical protein [Pirellula sp.]